MVFRVSLQWFFQLVKQVVASGRSLTFSHDDWVNRSFELADLGEAGRSLYHDLCRMDGDRYNPGKTDYNFTYALRHRNSNGRHLASFIKTVHDLNLPTNPLQLTPYNLPPTPTNPLQLTPYNLPPTPTNPLPFTNYIRQCRSNGSTLCQALVQTGLLTYDELRRVADLYHLGATRQGDVIFWLINSQGQALDGKVMSYLPNAHRNKQRNATWISALTRQSGSRNALFGEHLLPESTTTVALVESEKTALIMAAKLPQFTWLASGGMSMLNATKLEPLRGHKVLLFPDTDTTGEAFTKWQEIATEAAQHGIHVGVSDLLERCATTQQKEQKIDIADLILTPYTGF